MGMSTYVVGFKPVDDKWRAMYKIYAACDEAGIEPPSDVLAFFEGLYFKNIETTGIEVSLEKELCVTKWSDGDACEGYEVEVAKIPKDVKVIRFVNSY